MGKQVHQIVGFRVCQKIQPTGFQLIVKIFIPVGCHHPSAVHTGRFAVAVFIQPQGSVCRKQIKVKQNG